MNAENGHRERERVRKGRAQSRSSPFPLFSGKSNQQPIGNFGIRWFVLEFAPTASGAGSIFHPEQRDPVQRI
jgi:hypothetical protein